MYEYKVASFLPTVKSKDYKEGTALSEAKAQMEAFLQKHAIDGWELQGQYVFDYFIEQSGVGMFGRAAGKAMFGAETVSEIPTTQRYNALVFKRLKSADKSAL